MKQISIFFFLSYSIYEKINPTKIVNQNIVCPKQMLDMLAYIQQTQGCFNVNLTSLRHVRWTLNMRLCKTITSSINVH